MCRVGCELMLGETEQRRSVPLRLTPYVEVLFRDDAAPVAVEPGFVTEKLSLMHHALDVEGAAVGRQMIALFEHYHPQTAECQFIGGGRTAGTRADHDGIVLLRAHA